MRPYQAAMQANDHTFSELALFGPDHWSECSSSSASPGVTAGTPITSYSYTISDPADVKTFGPFTSSCGEAITYTATCDTIGCVSPVVFDATARTFTVHTTVGAFAGTSQTIVVRGTAGANTDTFTFTLSFVGGITLDAPIDIDDMAYTVQAAAVTMDFTDFAPSGAYTMGTLSYNVYEDG